MAYSWKRRDVSVWETTVAPILSVLIMLSPCAVILVWHTNLTGAGGVHAGLPWMIPVVIVMGVVYAPWLRTNRPQTHAILGQLSVNEGLDSKGADSARILASPAAVVQGGRR